MNTMNTMMQRALVLMLAYITVPSAAASERNMRNMRNWAGNVAFLAGETVSPASAAELAEAVRLAGGGRGAVHAVGSRHSFSAVADTIEGGALVSTKGMRKVLFIDLAKRTAAVEPGVSYAELGAALAERGLALPNYASLPHVTVAGAVMTGTHGSGLGNGILATAVASYDMVDAAGEVRRYDRDGGNVHGGNE